jgi:hypothetical protein
MLSCRLFTQLDRAKSTIRYIPPNGTAGLARSRVSGSSRAPRPPASRMLKTLSTLKRSFRHGGRTLSTPPPRRKEELGECVW